jgi:hypothetical protein
MAVPKKARTTTKNAGSKNATVNPETNGNVTSIDSGPQTNEDFAELVRRRAYEIYEQSGRPDGRDREHWLQAEAEILGRHLGRKTA